MQKRIPIISNLWPSMPRNETEERSGSFRPASPLASEAGWAQAAEAPKVIITAAVADARFHTKRHPRDTSSASQMRIADPPLIENDIRMTTGSGTSTGKGAPHPLMAERGNL